MAHHPLKTKQTKQNKRLKPKSYDKKHRNADFSIEVMINETNVELVKNSLSNKTKQLFLSYYNQSRKQAISYVVKFRNKTYAQFISTRINKRIIYFQLVICHAGLC